MGLVDGDIVTKRALCYGMLLPSGNDAAGATAVKLAGSYAAFAEQMNRKAQELGMTQVQVSRREKKLLAYMRAAFDQ